MVSCWVTFVFITNQNALWILYFIFINSLEQKHWQSWKDILQFLKASCTERFWIASQANDILLYVSDPIVLDFAWIVQHLERSLIWSHFASLSLFLSATGIHCTERKQKQSVLPSASAHSESGKTPAHFFTPNPCSAPAEIMHLHVLLVTWLTAVYFVFRKISVNIESGGKKKIHNRENT